MGFFLVLYSGFFFINLIMLVQSGHIAPNDMIWVEPQEANGESYQHAHT